MYKVDQAMITVHQQEDRRKQLLEEAHEEQRPRLSVSRVVYPGVTISFTRRVIAFQKELEGPVVIEERRIKNVTEAIAVNQLSGSIQILKSQRINIEELMRDFAPLATPTTASATPS